VVSARKGDTVRKILNIKAGDEMVQKMRAVAKAAAKNAYCPYSKFPVGAAVLTDDGEVFSGCNVENASLGLTICAERNAVFQAVARGYRKIVAVVIVTPGSSAATPCGACRQVISEFGNEAEVFSFDKDGNILHLRIDELLPKAFTSDTLSQRLRP
jgi:cytidine deaminase